MELYKKYIRKEELEAEKKFLTKQIELLRERLGIKATNYQTERVQGAKHCNTQEDVILQIIDMERDVEYITKEIDILNEHLTTLENIAKKYGDEYEKIVDLKKKGVKIVGIASEVNMSERTVKRRLEKVGLTRKQK
jgi:DNA-binding NarL/FixJ family response regulator